VTKVWNRLGTVGAISVLVALVGGIVVAFGDATGDGTLGVVGAVLLVAGVLCFFVTATQRAHREGVGVGSALARSGKDALRLAWLLLKGA